MNFEVSLTRSRYVGCENFIRNIFYSRSTEIKVKGYTGDENKDL